MRTWECGAYVAYVVLGFNETKIWHTDRGRWCVVAQNKNPTEKINVVAKLALPMPRRCRADDRRRKHMATGNVPHGGIEIVYAASIAVPKQVVPAGYVPVGRSWHGEVMVSSLSFSNSLKKIVALPTTGSQSGSQSAS